MNLENNIKKIIIDVLNLEDLTIDDIDSTAPLFGEGLGLDSIDALELGLAIKNHFGLVLLADQDENKKIFYSVRSLADYIATHEKNRREYNE